MKGAVLITRPKHDDTTHYLFYWAQEIIKVAKEKGIKILDLAKERANKKEFESVAVKMQPSFIFFNGHGDDDCVSGCDNKIIVKAGENEEKLKEKIIYALSCRSAKNLGVASIEAGAKTYVGYKDDFIFMYEPDKLSRPLEDKTAEMFLGPSNQLVFSILKGHTMGEAYEKSQESFMQNIQKLLTSESSDRNLIQYLFWDKIHQVCLGDKNASL